MAPSVRTLVRVASTAAAIAAVTAIVLPHVARAERGINPLMSDTTNVRRPKDKVKSFASAQQDNQRVLEARLEKRFSLRKEFAEKGIELKNAQVFYRIFKRERLFEVWAKDSTRSAFVLVKSYPICALTGEAGPKRVQGDMQTPEGFYNIDGFNPASGFHLSLHIDYPNKSDLARGGGKNLGGDIYVHGGCRTEGCLAVTDDAIKELYWISVEAYNAGQRKIPVHIFPARLTDESLDQLLTVFDKQPDLKSFWANLKTTYDYFETNKTVPDLTVDARGRYKIVSPAAAVANNN